MPNWSYNSCTVTGPESDIKAMFDLMVVKKDDGDKFDFNHLIPMPQELRNVTPCLEPDGKGGVKKVDKESGNPPDGHEKAGWDEWFYGHVPVEKQRLDEWRSRYGATNWYDWSWNNWGTNNNAFRFSTDYKDGSTAKFNFDTKWAFPGPIAKALSKKFPSLRFFWTALNEGWMSAPEYVGDTYEYCDGQLVKAETPLIR